MDLGQERHDLLLNELTHGAEDHSFFFAQAKVHVHPPAQVENGAYEVGPVGIARPRRLTASTGAWSSVVRVCWVGSAMPTGQM